MNKKKGSNFENELAKILYNNGFWVRLDKGYAQTCDMIAAKNNIIFLIECKTCKNDYFNLSRIEDNQTCSRKLFKVRGNDNAWIAYKLDCGQVYLSKDFINKPSNGIKLEEWLTNEY